MKKKFGFTLAEVLITLGIIGVVAALTAPALVKNSGQAKIGPSLAKFMNTFETGMEQFMQEQSISTLTGGEIAGLADHMIMTPYSKQYKFSDGTGGTPRTVLSGNEILDQINKSKEKCSGGMSNFNNDPAEYARNCAYNWDSMEYNTYNTTIWQLKDGSVMVFVPKLSIGDQNNGITPSSISKGAYKGVVAEILYDIDGDKDVNRAGKDVFSFLVDKTGVLIPAGSNAHKFITTDTEGQYGSTYMTSFVDKSGCSTTSTDIKNNFACTGAIADNGWKADY